MFFDEHVDIAVGKALALLGFVKRMSSNLKDHCVWRPSYDLFVNMIERVQKKFVRYALWTLG
jgi:hypothetical protein